MAKEQVIEPIVTITLVKGKKSGYLAFLNNDQKNGGAIKATREAAIGCAVIANAKKLGLEIEQVSV